ncbi:MAG: hypothetical protein HOV94_14830 [Saccharothrix sp.]|nr:hypothetical protein [Saccharothrix sp.]
MGKHRLGQTDGRQWGGPDLVTGVEDVVARRPEGEQPEPAAERVEEE